MNVTETTRLCKAISTLVPAQHFDDETPAFWALALADVRYEDARDAVVTLVRRQQWVGVPDIITEVRRIRLGRLEGVDVIEPNVDPALVDAWLREKRALTTALADGTLDVERYTAGGWTLTGEHPRAIASGPERPLPALGEVFQRPPRTTMGDYAPAALAPPPREVSPSEANAMEAERARQLSALESIRYEEAEAS